MDKTISTKTVFIAYLDDNDKKIEGYVILITKDINFITFKTGSNVITIPYNRLLKLKEIP